MIRTELTCGMQAATNLGMRETRDVEHYRQRRFARSARAALVAIAGCFAISGCISVNAPDKPIVIELNMNITMDVVYKLSSDASKTVDTNKDIF